MVHACVPTISFYGVNKTNIPECPSCLEFVLGHLERYPGNRKSLHVDLEGNKQTFKQINVKKTQRENDYKY